MSEVLFPEGFRLEPLAKKHHRDAFRSGHPKVDGWLSKSALQSQRKHLSATKVLVKPDGQIAGFYTLATQQVDFGDLPFELAKTLPRRSLPVAVLAWLGVDNQHQRLGLGQRLFAQALVDCFHAGKTFAFVAVLVDCLDESAKRFYQRWSLAEVPGHPFRLFLSSTQLDALMAAP